MVASLLFEEYWTIETLSVLFKRVVVSYDGSTDCSNCGEDVDYKMSMVIQILVKDSTGEIVDDML
jgi:hypothetical protein